MLRSILRKTFANKMIGYRSMAKLEVLGKYVQVLPVLQPSSAHPNGKILLSKWKSGNYQDRYTGLIERVPEEIITGVAQAKTNDPILDTAKEVIPIEIAPHISGIDLHGILKFDGPPDTLEYIYIANIKKRCNIKEIVFSENYQYSLEWFDLNRIPYYLMPLDDEIWFSYVLEGRKIRGSFIYSGLEERTVKSYELEQVKQF